MSVNRFLVEFCFFGAFFGRLCVDEKRALSFLFSKSFNFYEITKNNEQVEFMQCHDFN